MLYPRRRGTGRVIEGRPGRVRGVLTVCEHVFVMIVCVLFSRFALVAALEGRRELMGEAVALAPEAGRRQVVGEVSPAAEAFGVVPGMRVGEALARCPELRLVPPDPDGVRSLWRRALDRLERIGAACESDREGEAFFEADGLRGIHGGELEGVLGAARTAVGRGARIGCAPGRFSAYAAALRARPRRRAPAGGRGGLGVGPRGSVIVPAGAVR
ncbi:MAG: protein ImuB, partial [Thermoleophilaceae bacterium]|nr:protein ImuB [Thermoleophilaceae bacterium]